MKYIAAIGAVLVFAVAALASSPASDAAHAPKLWTCGSEDALWIAQLTHPPKGGIWAPDVPDLLVTLHVRRADGLWHRAPAVGVPLTSMVSHGSELALLLQDGQWLLTREDGATSGPQLPEGRLLALGSDNHGIWGLALLPGGIAGLAQPDASATKPTRYTGIAQTLPATEPARAPATAAAVMTPPITTVPSTVATAPARAATHPSPMVSLVRLDVDRWRGVADLPASIAAPGDEVQLALCWTSKQSADKYVAVNRPDGLRTYRYGGDTHWQPIGAPLPQAIMAAWKLVPMPDEPILWLAGASVSEPDHLMVRDASGQRMISLTATAGSPPSERALAWSGGKIRSIQERGGKLREQIYDPHTFAPSGETLAIQWEKASTDVVANWQYGIVTAAMVIAIILSFRQRETMRTVDAKALQTAKVRLAPTGRRFTAGVIDALPVITAFLIVLGRSQRSASGASWPWFDRISELVFCAGVVVYIIYTLIAELLVGRTIGKIICGLRVVSLDGKPTRQGQLVIRNLLRVIDAGLYFLPVLLVPFSPLRQRAGDVAAGTLVVQSAEEHETENTALK